MNQYQSLFLKYQTLSKNLKTIHKLTKLIIPIEINTVELIFDTLTDFQPLTFYNLLHIPRIKVYLIFQEQMHCKGYTLTIIFNKIEIRVNRVIL